MNLDLDNTGIIISCVYLDLFKAFVCFFFFFLHCLVYKILGREREGYEFLQHMHIVFAKLCKQIRT